VERSRRNTVIRIKTHQKPHQQQQYRRNEVIRRRKIYVGCCNGRTGCRKMPSTMEANTTMKQVPEEEVNKYIMNDVDSTKSYSFHLT
jgi:hypothetical protein